MRCQRLSDSPRSRSLESSPNGSGGAATPFERVSTSPAGRQSGWMGRLAAFDAAAVGAIRMVAEVAGATTLAGGSGVTSTASVNTTAAATNTFVNRRCA